MKLCITIATISTMVLCTLTPLQTSWASELHAVLVAAANKRTGDTTYEYVKLENALPKMHLALEKFASAVGLNMGKVVMLGQGSSKWDKNPMIAVPYGQTMNSSAIKTNIEAAIKYVTETAGDDDVVVFYFTGHGESNEDLDLNLIPDESQASFKEIVELNTILTTIRGNKRVKKKLVFIDACRVVHAHVLDYSMTPINKAYEGGIVTLLATKPKGFAFADEEERIGRFTKYLAKALEKVGILATDSSKRGLSLSHILDAINRDLSFHDKEQIAQAPANSATEWIYGSSDDQKINRIVVSVFNPPNIILDTTVLTEKITSKLEATLDTFAEVKWEVKTASEMGSSAYQDLKTLIISYLKGDALSNAFPSSQIIDGIQRIEPWAKSAYTAIVALTPTDTTETEFLVDHFLVKIDDSPHGGQVWFNGAAITGDKVTFPRFNRGKTAAFSWEDADNVSDNVAKELLGSAKDISKRPTVLPLCFVVEGLFKEDIDCLKAKGSNCTKKHSDKIEKLKLWESFPTSLYHAIHQRELNWVTLSPSTHQYRKFCNEMTPQKDAQEFSPLLIYRKFIQSVDFLESESRHADYLLYGRIQLKKSDPGGKLESSLYPLIINDFPWDKFGSGVFREQPGDGALRITDKVANELTNNWNKIRRSLRPIAETCRKGMCQAPN